MFFRAIILGLVLAVAGLTAASASSDGVPFPTIAKAIDGPCVRDPQLMRTDHMNLLAHTRDVTVRDGARNKKDSLQACLTCHQVADADGQAVGADNPQHFCRSCHDYAAVTIDCFQCHNSKPAKGTQK